MCCCMAKKVFLVFLSLSSFYEREDVTRCIFIVSPYMVIIVVIVCCHVIVAAAVPDQFSVIAS